MELKEAIEILKKLSKNVNELLGFVGVNSSVYKIKKNEVQAIDTILQVIEELQKENEDLKTELLKRDATYYRIEACRKEIEGTKLITESLTKRQKLINNTDYISKDKIRKVMDGDSFEVWTREYGNVDVVTLDSLDDLLKEED